MPAVSQQQQKIFGLALAVKRGEVSRSEASQEVLDIVDSMSEKDIEDFASTKHAGLPKKVEQKIREMARQTIRERMMSEANFRKGDMVRVVDNPKYVMDKKKFAGMSGYVKNTIGRDIQVTFPNGRTIMVDPKDLEMNPNESVVNEGKFKVDDLVYNKRTKTVGIVRMGDDKYGEVKTDADGNVSVDELEKYNPIKFKHQSKAKVAPSTEKEINKRGLFNPFRLESVVSEADVVGKTVFSDGKGKLVFGYYKDDDGVTLVDYKTWAKLNMKDVSKGDTNKDRVIKAILQNQKQFNKKVDYNMWAKKTNPSFEQKMDWFIKNGWISNINKGGIRESVNEASDDYDYANELQNAVKVALKGKNIKGWRLDVDSRAGTFEYTKKGINLVVYATPMWDGNKFVPFNVQNMEGDDVDMIQRVIGNRLSFKPTYDVKKDVSNYLSVVTNALSKTEQVYSKLNIESVVNEAKVELELDLFKNYNQRRPDKTMKVKVSDTSRLSQLSATPEFNKIKKQYNYIEWHYGDKFLGSMMAGTDNWEFKKGNGLSGSGFRESVK